ncbi:MATE family efflux transporter [Maricaulis sp. D1M11]|uniref:MATE family efflux transporter n=1 Tax=Maricaulis sp. D1M11 TaxID=3076117 RepID=UPI0039B3AEBA
MEPASLSRTDVHLRAWPLVFANAAIPLAAAVDTFVLGLSGNASELGGVALGGTVFSVFYWSFYFLRMGTTGLTAQADGAQRHNSLIRILVRALLIGTLLGLLVLVFSPLIATGGFMILQGGPDAEAMGREYFLARAWGAPAALAGFALSGWLIGLNRNLQTTMIYVLFSAVNIGLDLVFVLMLEMGPAGVGYATSIADWLALALALLLAWRTIQQRGGLETDTLSMARLRDPAALLELFQVNINLMLRTWSMVIGFSWFANAGARQGDAVLAGNHVLLQIISLWAFVLDAFAFVAESEAGRAFGRASRSALRRAIRLTAEPMIVAGTVFAVLTAMWGDEVLTVLIANEEARTAAIRYLPWCAIVPLLGVPAWLLDGVFIGTTSGKVLRNAGFASLAIYLALDAVLAPQWGNQGVWAAFVLYYIARAGALAVAYPGLERRLQSVPTASETDEKPSA